MTTASMLFAPRRPHEQLRIVVEHLEEHRLRREALDAKFLRRLLTEYEGARLRIERAKAELERMREAIRVTHQGGERR